MGADELAENTPNGPKLSAQIVCPSPKNLDLDKEKALLDIRSPCFSAFQAGIAAQCATCLLQGNIGTSGFWFQKKKCYKCFNKPIADKGHRLEPVFSKKWQKKSKPKNWFGE